MRQNANNPPENHQRSEAFLEHKTHLMIASLPSPAFATVASITISRNLDMILAGPKKILQIDGPRPSQIPQIPKGLVLF